MPFGRAAIPLRPSGGGIRKHEEVIQASPGFSEFRPTSILKNNTFGGGSYVARPSGVSEPDLSRVQPGMHENLRPSRPDESLIDQRNQMSSNYRNDDKSLQIQEWLDNGKITKSDIERLIR